MLYSYFLRFFNFYFKQGSSLFKALSGLGCSPTCKAVPDTSKSLIKYVDFFFHHLMQIISYKIKKIRITMHKIYHFNHFCYILCYCIKKLLFSICRASCLYIINLLLLSFVFKISLHIRLDLYLSYCFIPCYCIIMFIKFLW